MAVAQAVLSETRARDPRGALRDVRPGGRDRTATTRSRRSSWPRGARPCTWRPRSRGSGRGAAAGGDPRGRGAARRARRGGIRRRPPLDARTQIVHAFREQDPDAKLGLLQLKALTCSSSTRCPDEAGQNPNWEAIGYPGPSSAPPSAAEAPKTIAVDAVVGAGGDAHRRRLRDRLGRGRRRGRGRAAPRRARTCSCSRRAATATSPDFNQLELPGYLELYYGGGLAAHRRSGSIALLAGQTLGGGTVVNYMNCVRTPDSVRARVGTSTGSRGSTTRRSSPSTWTR